MPRDLSAVALSVRQAGLAKAEASGEVGRVLELARTTLPWFAPHDVTPFLTSWTRRI